MWCFCLWGSASGCGLSSCLLLVPFWFSPNSFVGCRSFPGFFFSSGFGGVFGLPLWCILYILSLLYIYILSLKKN